MKAWSLALLLLLLVAMTMAVTVSCGDDDDDDDDDNDDAADDDDDDDDDNDDDGDDDDDDDEFTFGSSAFNDGDVIPIEYTCGATKGAYGVSPPLEWANPPEGTVGYAITLYDTDIDFGHWGIINIPADTFSLAEALSPGGTLPGDAFEVMNDYGMVEYGGPCPPPGETHNYEFKLYALSEMAPDTPTKGWCVHSILDTLVVVAIISILVTFSSPA
jgi:Raf kinase inhibitor-like YbhB/YbcL family protein